MRRSDNETDVAAAGAEHTGHWRCAAVATLLALTFVTGGGSYDRGLGDVLAQLLAVAVLGWSLWSLIQRPHHRYVWWPLAVAGLVVAVVAVQGLPLPAGIWQTNGARAALLADLTAAGADTMQLHWSLTPWATERSLWSLLPASALFVGALTLDPRQRRRTVLLVIGLAVASLVLGYLQLGAPQDSLLNPFPEWAPALNGVFANQNHQATAIAVALVLLLALLLESPEARGDAATTAGWMRLAMLLAGVFLLASLPLTTSRAMAVLALLALLMVPLLSGTATRWLRASRLPRSLAWLGLALGILAMWGVLLGALQWVQVDAAEEHRGAVAQATAAMGLELAPWGAGVGSFVPWFDQAAPDRLIFHAYFNHAHNEYMQWWLESGVAGLVALAAVLALLVWSRPWAGRGASRSDAVAADAIAVGSWVAVLLVLAHSAVDYPLRTPAMMAVTALLAGFAVAGALRNPQSARPSGGPGHPVETVNEPDRRHSSS